MEYLEKLNLVSKSRNTGPFAERIISQITYLHNISSYKGGIYDKKIEKALDFLIEAIKCNGVITMDTVKVAEEMLMELASVAKSYKQMFLAHAHIDMNWMWGYNETVAVTVDTFRTVLNLMKEYPEFTYGQSQASTYEIIEKYAPEMLEEIKQYIREGRWEVTASEWVEPDKNMPNGESLTRQILQTKKYLSKLLEIPAETLCIDFVPDTFGHNINVPEILVNAGVKYMYHCRGYKGKNVYRYRSPSGKSTLNYCEFGWYNGAIRPSNFEVVPKFCSENNIDTFLCVYGVGDHGGGPSRRDIERILEYKSWPLTPDIQFGTLGQFFAYLENSGTEFPVVESELNFVLTGCYTTQSRIKMANRIAEARINEAEQLLAAAGVFADQKRKTEAFDKPWRNILFNHFHDILPGSGTIETREYAMGLFQEALATINTSANASMRAIADKIDTSSIPFVEDIEEASEGAGVGYFQSQNTGFRFPAVERGSGSVRAVHIFNTTQYARDEYTEITLWDYSYGVENLFVTDASGKALSFAVNQSGEGYWDHTFIKLLVRVKAEPFSYTTVIVSQNDKKLVPNYDFYDPHEFGTIQPRTESEINSSPHILENELVKAVVDSGTGCLLSLTDKKTGNELISKESGCFRFIEENPVYEMTSWRVGPYMKVINLNTEYGVRFECPEKNEAFSKIAYTLRFKSSVLKCEIILKNGSSVLEYNVNVDWHELPVKSEMIPQLSFAVPVSYNAEKAIYDVPYGEIKRAALAHDVPALSFMNIEGNQPQNIGICTDTKYGYRFWNGCGSVTLIRSAYDPDKYPESGIHDIRIGIMVASSHDMKRISSAFNHPMSFTPTTKHKGVLPLENTLLKVEGDICVSCVKNSEDNKGIAVRLYDTEGVCQKVKLSFAKEVTRAVITDSNENEQQELAVKNGKVELEVEPYSVVTAVVRFE